MATGRNLKRISVTIDRYGNKIENDPEKDGLGYDPRRAKPANRMAEEAGGDKKKA